MGNDKVIERHYHHEKVVQDPELLKRLDRSDIQINQLREFIKNLEKQLQVAREQAKKQKNPAVYKKLANEAFQTFLGNVQTMEFQQRIPKVQGERHHVVMGNVSSGKSSSLNHNLGTKLPVGMGHTTTQLSKVACSKNKKVWIWDSPGCNVDFEFYDPVNLSYFHSADRIFILYCDSLHCIQNILKVIYAIKPNHTYLIRTQCDRFDADQSKTVQQELQADKKFLQSIKIKLPVLAVSSRKGDDFLDNLKYKKLLNGQQ